MSASAWSEAKTGVALAFAEYRAAHAERRRVEARVRQATAALHEADRVLEEAEAGRALDVDVEGKIGWSA